MQFLLKDIPGYLKDKLNVLRQILFTAAFAVIFINVYSPFNAENWFDVGKAEFFLYSSFFILAGMLVIVFSRFVFIKYAKHKEVNYLAYIVWNLLEIVLLALAYTIMNIYILKTGVNPFEQYIKSLLVTVFVLAIPYSLSWLYYSWQEQKRKLQELSQETSNEYSSKSMINFYDETSKLRFSLYSKDVLYIESTDNYVTVFVDDKDRVKKIMLRNTMKRLEKELGKTMIRRCHRSFMVNFENVKMVRLSGTSLYIYLDSLEELKIPVSRTYAEKVHEFINQLSM